MRSMKARAVVSVLVLVMVMSVSAGTRLASAVDPPAATVKVWDTATPIPPSISLGMTPGESVEDPDGLTGHGTSFPTVVTVYARGTNPGGPSGVSYWNPEGNVFVWYGKTMPGGYSLTMPVPPSSGFPGGVDINRGGGPVLAGGPCGASFGAGDVWVGGQQNEPLYVHLAGTDCFRSYATDNGLLPPTSQVFGVEVDEASGDVFLAQPWEGRISRVHPPTAEATVWNFGGSCGSGGASCGNPSYVTIDPAGRPYATVTSSVFGDGIVRVNLGADGILGTADDTISIWPIPTQPAFIRPPLFMSESEQNPNGIITADANGNIWFSESNSGKIGRLSGNEICEYTTPGLSNPQQIVTVGSGDQLQVVFTEGNGNSVSVLTQAEADQASFPNRVCTIVAAQTFSTPVVKVIARMFDEEVSPLRTAIVPTVHQVTPVGGSGIQRFSPMPNPLLSVDGTPIGDAGNGFPSGLTGVYATQRIAGAYLKGNKHFEFHSGAITAPPPGGTVPGRMTGGGRLSASDGTKVTYGFVLLCPPSRGHDALEVNWASGNRFHLEQVSSASCSDDPSISPDPPSASFDTHRGSGTGRYNGVSGYTVEWTYTDAGEPGTSDTARIVIRDAFGFIILDVSGTLEKGNNQAHDAGPR